MTVKRVSDLTPLLGYVAAPLRVPPAESLETGITAAAISGEEAAGADTDEVTEARQRSPI